MWRAVVLLRGATYRHKKAGRGRGGSYLFLPSQRKRNQDHEQDNGQEGVEAGKDYEDHEAESPRAVPRGLDQRGRL